jgi:hypothetical protein
MFPAMVDKVMCRISDQTLRDHENAGKSACSEPESRISEMPVEETSSAL